MSAKKRQKKTEAPDDISYEGEYDSARDRDPAEAVKKLKEDLKQCRAERQEYLSGWQRLKADTVNARSKEAERVSAVRETERVSLLEALLPTLDSFDMAMQSPSWEAVDPQWKSGMEAVAVQMKDALASIGAESFGVEGDRFDPHLHEAVASTPVSSEHPDGVVSKVLRRGWKIGNRVVRPAQCEVAHAD